LDEGLSQRLANSATNYMIHWGIVLLDTPKELCIKLVRVTVTWFQSGQAITRQPAMLFWTLFVVFVGRVVTAGCLFFLLFKKEEFDF
jgi:hypothetical protein